MMPKCPKCDALVRELSMETVDAALGARKWRAVVYCCQFCGAVLGAGLDPLALKTDTASAVVEALRKG